MSWLVKLLPLSPGDISVFLRAGFYRSCNSSLESIFCICVKIEPFSRAGGLLTPLVNDGFLFLIKSANDCSEFLIILPVIFIFSLNLKFREVTEYDLFSVKSFYEGVN